MIEMPSIKRIPIPTKGNPWWKRYWMLLTYPLRWEVAEDYYYTLRGGIEIVIPRGFVMDLASIPRIFWWIPGLSPAGILQIPGLIHDYAYKFNHLLLKDEEYLYCAEYGKAHWDNMFREIGLDVNGVILIDWIAWAAVRLGGWKAWRKHRKNETMP